VGCSQYQAPSASSPSTVTRTASVNAVESVGGGLKKSTIGIPTPYVAPSLCIADTRTTLGGAAGFVDDAGVDDTGAEVTGAAEDVSATVVGAACVTVTVRFRPGSPDVHAATASVAARTAARDARRPTLPSTTVSLSC
jgi:hypothetical protein